MQTRLHAIDPKLANLVCGLDESISIPIARQVADLAAIKLAPATIFPKEESELMDFAECLDSAYLTVQERADRGQATNQDVLNAFIKARTANAVLFGIQGNAIEAIYESVIATDDLAGVNALVHKLLA